MVVARGLSIFLHHLAAVQCRCVRFLVSFLLSSLSLHEIMVLAQSGKGLNEEHHSHRLFLAKICSRTTERSFSRIPGSEGKKKLLLCRGSRGRKGRTGQSCKGKRAPCGNTGNSNVGGTCEGAVGIRRLQKGPGSAYPCQASHSNAI
ncbi:hypothetical protein IW261DRAFT_1521740 [Armillaria novae-zelandiae]|uniref:Secreted protein n=1 Tax=Armillaria novae-zelandiae TaxID=153914 RepID=A0AA39TQ12_9AGAR|nr:hypothetical protein IW261DRAFT_1521740 [Armillaria novae-zelandiae]